MADVAVNVAAVAKTAARSEADADDCQKNCWIS